VYECRVLGDEIVPLQRELENLRVLGLSEPYRRIGRRPFHDGVGVHRKPMHIPTPSVALIRLHDGFGPLRPAGFAAAGSHSDLQHLLLVLLSWIEVADEAAVNLELAQIIIRGHVAAAVPPFGSYAKKLKLQES